MANKQPQVQNYNARRHSPQRFVVASMPRPPRSANSVVNNRNATVFDFEAPTLRSSSSSSFGLASTTMDTPFSPSSRQRQNVIATPSNKQQRFPTNEARRFRQRLLSEPIDSADCTLDNFDIGDDEVFVQEPSQQQQPTPPSSAANNGGPATMTSAIEAAECMYQQRQRSSSQSSYGGGNNGISGYAYRSQQMSSPYGGNGGYYQRQDASTSRILNPPSPLMPVASHDISTSATTFANCWPPAAVDDASDGICRNHFGLYMPPSSSAAIHRQDTLKHLLRNQVRQRSRTHLLSLSLLALLPLSFAFKKAAIYRISVFYGLSPSLSLSVCSKFYFFFTLFGTTIEYKKEQSAIVVCSGRFQTTFFSFRSLSLFNNTLRGK